MKFTIEKQELEYLYYNKKLNIKEIAKLYNVSYTLIRNWMIIYSIERRNSKELSRKYHINDNYFEIIDTEEKAYWLGFIYADGCIMKTKNSYRISLTQTDKNVLDSFSKSISSSYPIRAYISNTGFTKKNGEKSRYYIIVLNSNKLAIDLINKGCTTKKSLKLKFPTEEQVPKHLIHHFIRGYFDGDGCVSITRSTRHYNEYSSISYYLIINISGTKEFLEGIKDNFNFLEKDSNVIHKELRTNTNCYNLKLTSSKRSLLFYDYIYKDSNLYMKRKRETFRDYNGNYHKKVDRIVRSV